MNIPQEKKKVINRILVNLEQTIILFLKPKSSIFFYSLCVHMMTLEREGQWNWSEANKRDIEEDERIRIRERAWEGREIETHRRWRTREKGQKTIEGGKEKLLKKEN